MKPEAVNMFASELALETLSVPTMFLKNYHKAGLDDIQLLIIVHLLTIDANKNIDQILTELNNRMTCSKDQIKERLALLIEKNIVSIAGKLQSNILVSLFYTSWQQDKMPMSEIAVTYDEVASLYTTFEQEFGRLLTPMEGEQIKEWVEKDNFEYSLIKGALKRSVMRGVLNFKYIDSILREWKRKSFRTINEVITFEEKFKAKENQTKDNQKTGRRNQLNLNDKYKDIYMG
ncbi:MAG: DnaD domain protein [Bacillota bacterium]|nr:DnaD domain protein [Bacillota bacterium]